jgi:hemerythrin
MEALLEWHDEDSVGIKELDIQHQNILNLINSLQADDDDGDFDKLSLVISSMIHHSYTHFASEERYLLEADYPDFKHHVLEHVTFIMRTLELSLKIKEGAKGSRMELLHYLKDWYSKHILGMDRLYIPFLKDFKNK